MKNVNEYALEVANRINEVALDLRAEVCHVTKANGVEFVGVSVKEDGSNVAANVYMEQFCKNDVSVEDAADQAIDTFYASKPDFDVDCMYDWENVKGRLRAVLLNEKNATQYPIHQSAKRYGFDDLIITAKVKLDLGLRGSGSVQVTPELIEKWGATKAEVLRQAIANAKEDCVIKTMSSILAEMMGADLDNLGMPDDDGMLVVTNADKVYGAIAVIAAREELQRRFPGGYAVLPSSVHEVIVVGDPDNANAFTQMVGEVNEAEVAAEEVLSNHAYVFRREAE